FEFKDGLNSRSVRLSMSPRPTPDQKSLPGEGTANVGRTLSNTFEVRSGFHRSASAGSGSGFRGSPPTKHSSADAKRHHRSKSNCVSCRPPGVKLEAMRGE